AMQSADAAAAPGSGSPHTGLPDVVLAGPANAGKSSLFNRLVASSRATRALVTRHAGTTRDATCAELDDPPMRLWDTAGLRGANDGVDASAEGLSLALATSCDLVVWCWSADMPDWQPPPFDASRCVVLQTRADLPAAWPLQSGAMAVSARTGAGLDALRAAVRERLAGREVRSSATFANARQSAHLHAATAAVSRALPLAGGGRTLELAAAELGEADRELAALLGVEPATGVASEQILQRIFAGFCVGK
ncbi:MAG: GTPase, partial [Planctomycetota bacterium]